MEESKEHEKQNLSMATIVSLIIGLLSVSATLFIFYSSRSRPALVIEQKPAIIYASTKGLSTLGQVKVSVNGKSISDLLAIPFVIRNTGNVPLSSVPNTSSFNLARPISLEFSGGYSNANSIQIFVIQAPGGPEAPFTYSFENSEKSGTVRIELRTLNIGDETSFTVLLTASGDPSVKLITNPLIGGITNLVSTTKSEPSESLWIKIKNYWLALVLGIILLSQFPIILIWLVIEAKELSKKEQQDKIKDQISNDPAKKIAEEENNKKILSDLDGMVTKSIEKSLLNKLVKTQIPIPKEMFGEGVVSTSIFDLFKQEYKNQWIHQLERKYSTNNDPFSSFDRFEYISTTWWNWDDYWKGALSIGAISFVIGFLGYALVFY